MTIFEAIILGLVQGLAEFLPISSSGHLSVVQSLFGFEEPMVAFDVLLHVGTLIPVVIVFWQDIFVLVKNPFQKMTGLIIAATLPLVVMAVVLGDAVDILFSGGIFLAAAFIITGILLIICDKLPEGHKKEKDITYLDALLIGVVQAIAITPGISRSGSTITASTARGLNKSTAASFSFLLSIPAICGALVLQLKDLVTGEADFSGISLIPALAGFLTAMVSGYFAIRFMLRLIKNKKLVYFSYYLFILAALMIIDIYVTGFVF